MKKALVAYYSRSGNCEKIAGDISTMLNADVDEIKSETDYSGAAGYIKSVLFSKFGVEDKINYICDPGKYEVVVIVSPVWSNNVPPPVRTYAVKNSGKIKVLGILMNAYREKGKKVLQNFNKIMTESFAEKVIYTANLDYEIYYKDLEDFADRLRIYLEKEDAEEKK